MKKFQPVLFVLLALVTLAMIIVACKPVPTPTQPPTDIPVPTEPFVEKNACLDGLSFSGPAKVVVVNDADTLQIETPSGIEVIDLVGVNGWNDSPREEDGKQFVKDLVEGKEIELALDPVVQSNGGKPAYYVYEGDVFVNLEVLANGHARPRAEVVDKLVCGEVFKEATP